MISMLFKLQTKSKSEEDMKEGTDDNTIWDGKHQKFTPIYLKDSETSWNLDCQKAFLKYKDERLDNSIKEALQSVKEYFKNQTTPLFQSEVYAKLKRTEFTDNCCADDVVWNMICNVPIYLVTVDMGNEYKRNYNPQIPDNSSKIPDLDKYEPDENNPFVNEPTIVIERLACYQSYPLKEPTSLCSLGDTRRIFMWVDKIKEALDFTKSKYQCNVSYKDFFTYVLIHELTHALLDVYRMEMKADVAINNPHDNIFSLYREESIAEGFALYSMYDINNEFAEILAKYIKDGSAVAYQLGIAFYTKDVLKVAIHNWMSIKSGRQITYKAAQDWLKNANGSKNAKRPFGVPNNVNPQNVIDSDNELYNSSQTNP